MTENKTLSYRDFPTLEAFVAAIQLSGAFETVSAIPVATGERELGELSEYERAVITAKKLYHDEASLEIADIEKRVEEMRDDEVFLISRIKTLAIHDLAIEALQLSLIRSFWSRLGPLLDGDSYGKFGIRGDGLVVDCRENYEACLLIQTFMFSRCPTHFKID